MLPLSSYLSFQRDVLALYAAGFTVIAPPFAWAGLVTGLWMNRGNPLASRLAGALLAAVVGADVAVHWQAVADQAPSVNWVSRLPDVGRAMVWTITTYWERPDVVLIGVQTFLPILLALLLCVLAGRYEEGFAGGFGRFRERRAARRAEKAAERERERLTRSALVPAGLPETEEAPRFNFEPARPPVVVEAQPGEAVALPPEATGGKSVVIVVRIGAPSPVRLGRGRLVGLCVALYYLAATASRLWLPLLALWAWFYGPGLLASILRGIKDGLHLPF